jgi:hypothetical protein
MARYPLVDPSTVVLTEPAAGRLLLARDSLAAAETSFYRGRRNLVNSYPMKTRDITTAEIEGLYDTHLGTEPWRYKSRFDSSGSTLKTGSYGSTTGEFWMQEWGTTPSDTYPQIRTVGIFSGAPTSFLYDTDRGASWVDLIVRYGYNNGFDRRGSSTRYSYTTGAGDGASTTYYDAYEGFGELPVAYNGRGGLSGFEAHMLKLVGDAWEGTVRSAFSEYRDALDAYRGGVGSGPPGLTFTPTSTVHAWSGFTGTSGGYNRPGQLNPAIVHETRGRS